MSDVEKTLVHIRGHFADRAKLPEKQLAEAEGFVAELKKLEDKGMKPGADMVASGRQILKDVAHQTEVYAYNAAIMVGQEAKTENEVHKMLAHVMAGVERLESTQRMLRSALKDEAIA